MQAIEAIKLLAGMGDSLKGKLMVCDFRDMYFATVEIFKRLDCPVCQVKDVKPVEKVERLVWLCGRHVVNVNPPRLMDMKLGEIFETIKRHFRVLVKSSLVIVFQYNGGVEVSLFNGGRMLMKNVKDEESALQMYNKIIEKLGVKLPPN